MYINYRPVSIHRSNDQPKARFTSSMQTTFKGNEPPKMPEFLKPYREYGELCEKKRPGKLKSALFIGGATAGLGALTVATHVFLPVALAGIATFIGGYVIVMKFLDKVDPQLEKPPGLKPMTPEQIQADIRYTNELEHYNRKQKIAKAKKFLGL